MYFRAHAQSVIKTLSVNDPAGIVLDPKGNAYIVETGKNRILEFNKNGTLMGHGVLLALALVSLITQ
jgi:DNA-binding beta-propeller fold protein YncE